MPVSYENSKLAPLRTDRDIEARVADLIGRAQSRQLWMLFLDDADIQLPVLIPIGGFPTTPFEHEAEAVASRAVELMAEIGAHSVVTVLERYGPESLTAQDVAWVRALRTGFALQGTIVRAELLSHRAGVRLISRDECAD